MSLFLHAPCIIYEVDREKFTFSSFLTAYEDGTQCSETSAYKIQAPGNYPEGSMKHSEQGENFKQRKNLTL